MSILICDICGTSYSDSDDKCPTCGYGRAFDAADMEEERPHAVHEKVRGGRFSKKNVRKRLMEKEKDGDHGLQAADMVFAPGQEYVPETEPAAAEQTEAELPQLLPAEPEVQPAPAAGENEDEKKQKVLAVYRRDVARNLTLFFLGVLLVVSAVYLTIHYGIPWLQSVNQPGQAVIVTEPSTEPSTEEQTEVVTDPPTEPPSDAPTDPPTEPPTEAPTAPATEPPVEEPTKALLDVKLTLNYYDLTFGAATQTTQLKTDGIPLEDVTWISDDPNVVTVSSTGLITAVGGGKTTVRAIYGDQEVTVKINCRF